MGEGLSICILDIIFIALLLGWGFNFLWNFLRGRPELFEGVGARVPFLIRIFSGIVLLALILYAASAKKLSTSDLEVYVSGFHCTSCKLTLEEVLREIPQVKRVEVEVGNKLLKIKGEVSLWKYWRRWKRPGIHLGKKRESSF